VEDLRDAQLFQAGESGRLDEVDQVAASILESDRSDGSHRFGFTTEDDAERAETRDLGVDVARDERGSRDAGVEESLLVVTRGRKTERLQDKLDALDTIRRSDGEPTIRPSHGDIGAFLKAELFRVKREGAILVVDHYADELDLHECLRDSEASWLTQLDQSGRIPRRERAVFRKNEYAPAKRSERIEAVVVTLPMNPSLFYFENNREMSAHLGALGERPDPKHFKDDGIANSVSLVHFVALAQ